MLRNHVFSTAKLAQSLAQAEAGAQQAAAQVEAVQFPASWTKQGDDGRDGASLGWWHAGRCAMPVGRGSREWEAVASQLTASVRAASVTAVERLENRLL